MARAGIAAAALYAAVCLTLASGPSARAATADYERGLELGSQAYEYGIPLLDMARIFRTNTSVSRPDGRGNAPVNRFSHARQLASPEDRTVVAPNHDTLYSIAWLDLSRQPRVLHVPRMRRFYAFELVSPWTENFRNISSATGHARGGDFAIVGPGFEGRLPRGVTPVRSPYDRVWLIGRTLIRGEGDTRRVNRIQDRYALTPLARFGKRFTPRQTRPADMAVDRAAIPGFGPGDDPLSFYSALGRQMRRFAPPEADAPILETLRAIGVGPGLDPAAARLSPDTLQGMRDAVTGGPAGIRAKLTARFLAEFGRHNGYLLGDVGHYGTDYELRAITDLVGVGALRPRVAIYAFAQTAADLTPLTGGSRYVLHIPPDRLPIPVDGFWSLTLYDAEMFFFANPFDRYVLNDRSPMHLNPDGSLDIYVQPDPPADPARRANWLPSPPGGFRLLWRLYDAGDARHGILDGSGWQPPRILPCGPDGQAADGTACAS